MQNQKVLTAISFFIHCFIHYLHVYLNKLQFITVWMETVFVESSESNSSCALFPWWVLFVCSAVHKRKSVLRRQQGFLVSTLASFFDIACHSFEVDQLTLL